MDPPIDRRCGVCGRCSDGARREDPGMAEDRERMAPAATADHLALAMVEEREARLRSILETAPDAIISIDDNGIVQSFSRAAVVLFGYEPGEVIGRNVSMLMDSPHSEKHDDYIARYKRTGKKRIIGIGREVHARRKDGSIFPMHLSVGEVRLRDSLLFTGFIRDLTQRDRMEQELRQSQKMEAIGQLTGGVAHDFNNLLTVISANLEMLEMRLKDPGDRELVAEAQEATMLGAQLASRLLAFGRRQPLLQKPTDLNAVVEGMLDLLRRTLGATIDVQTGLQGRLPLVLADAGQFENVLLNLAINARDAMPKGGHLAIATRTTEIDPSSASAAGLSAGQYVSVTVRDTGTGMTPEIRQRAFEPFFTTKETGKGTGLGLSMVYGFVKQSGGHVTIESTLGSGTTIEILLPVLQHKQPLSERTRPPRAAMRQATETVLLVEDDARVRRATQRRLTSLGYTVLEAESAAAALEILAGTAKVDLLFTDVLMPGGLSGIELAGEVQQRHPEIKILLVSGFAAPEAVQEGVLRTGALWLRKPYSLKLLQQALAELLGGRPSGKARR